MVCAFYALVAGLQSLMDPQHWLMEQIKREWMIGLLMSIINYWAILRTGPMTDFWQFYVLSHRDRARRPSLLTQQVTLYWPINARLDFKQCILLFHLNTDYGTSTWLFKMHAFFLIKQFEPLSTSLETVSHYPLKNKTIALWDVTMRYVFAMLNEQIPILQ